VVTADGTLVDGFNLIVNFKNAHKVRGEHVAVLRSADKGVSWDSQATLVDDLDEIGVTDPTTGAAVRTGDIIPEIAVAPGTNTVYMVWQDARSTGGARDQIVFARSTDAWPHLADSVPGDQRRAHHTGVQPADPGATRRHHRGAVQRLPVR